ncbi:putative zinc protease [Halobacteriovorax marinus SJ]|uniref:Zinc protease n=1 Tax=Halobacteriovorax marinus (strain ATCC BAA-682 / DSM 15412 / SJ) TaxID=862908 RepID=E1WZI1_HALMS|nr:pitrilysin family protein [Halobacteriovorax marinus]CBW26167.1 putative zinc protease [Halobacteriovorax marinus SJ]
MNKTIILLLLVSLLGCSGMSKQEDQLTHSTSDLKIDVKKYTLSNGLRLLVVENPQLPIYSYYTFFDVGGRYESKGTTGATHFLEHMMFKGAKKYGPHKFDTFIESNGGSTNAYTTFDSTVYYENLPSHTLETMIDMEADRLSYVLLEPKAFEKERAVVLEERKYRYENSPKGQLFLAMMQSVFKGTPYGGSVIGDAQDVKNLQIPEMRKFFDQFYTPDNAIVVIVGDVKADEVYKMVKDKYGDLKASNGLAEFKKKMDSEERYSHRARYKQEVKLYGKSPIPIFTIAYKGKKIGEKDAYVMDILSSIFGDGSSSYFYQKYVRGKKPILSRINVANYTLRNNGVFFFTGELLPNTNLTKFKRKALKDIRRSCDDAITDRTVQKTKNQYLISYYSQLQSNSGIASFVGLRENFYNDYSFYEKELEIYQSITAEQVKEVCHQLFDDNEYIFLSVWDKHKAGKK